MGVKTTRNSVRKHNQAGFTLMEIAFAVLILAGSLTVLLALLASILDQTLRDRNTEHAMLGARKILAAMEVDSSLIKDQNTTTSLPEMIEQFAGKAGMDEADQQLKALEAHLVITDQPLPGIDDKAMKRIELTIGWGRDPTDSVTITYFVPNEESDDPDPAT